eukprot:Gb_36295 [translate_table: standard]
MARLPDMEGQLIAEHHTAQKTKTTKNNAHSLHQSCVSLHKVSMTELMPKPPISPVKFKSNSQRNRCGSAISIIPKEARGKKKESFECEEPKSPKVTCIGQIKLKHRKGYRGITSNQRVERGPRDQPKWEAKLSLQALKRFFVGTKEGTIPGSSDTICCSAPDTPVQEPHAVVKLFKSEGVHMDMAHEGSRREPEKYEKLYELKQSQNAGARPEGIDEEEAATQYSQSALIGDLKKIDPLPKPASMNGPSQINLWKRRSLMVPPKALDVNCNNIRPSILEIS